MSFEDEMGRLLLHEKPQSRYSDPLLSVREQDVLKWLAKGLTKIEIGSRLNISSHTVDYHVRNILLKLEAKNVTSAVYFAVSKGWLQPA